MYFFSDSFQDYGDWRQFELCELEGENVSIFGHLHLLSKHVMMTSCPQRNSLDTITCSCEAMAYTGFDGAYNCIVSVIVSLAKNMASKIMNG